MAWSEPKTDWVSTDKVNVADYNRWKNNLLYLKDLSVELFGSYTTVTLYSDKTISNFPLASEINALETFLATVNTNTYGLSIGSTQTYSANGHTIDYAEINRIESAMLWLYKMLHAHKNALRHLAFTLGGERAFDTVRE